MNVRKPGKIELKVINKIPNAIIYNIFLSYLLNPFCKTFKSASTPPINEPKSPTKKAMAMISGKA